MQFIGVTMKQTLYDILEVAQDASFEDIEIAYAKRFAVLRSETSWDSNRLVMLNEAREVLSDPGRRAAYDSSLAVVPARARAHSQVDETDREARSYGKWPIVFVVLAGLAVWLVMRDDATPERSVATQNSDAPEASNASGQADSIDDETVIEVELPSAGESADTSASTLAVQTEEAVMDDGLSAEEAVDEFDATNGQSVPPAPEPIVGNWDCFDPVTGRTITVTFTADGSFTMRQSNNQVQTFAYEVAGGQVMLADADPPRAMGIGELSANKLILLDAVEGRSIVCSR